MTINLKEFGEDLLKNLEKTIILQSIDQNWKDHLGQLENLRQIVGLRVMVKEIL